MKHLQKFTSFIYEELDIENSYFTKKKDQSITLENEVKRLIKIIIKDFGITLPIEPYSNDFIKIKKELSNQIKTNKVITDYVDEWGLDKKTLDEILRKICTTEITPSKVKQPTKKFDIDHLDFKLIDDVDNVETYQVIFPEDVKKFIQDNPDTNKLDSLIYINCESDKFNRLHFPGRIERIYRGHGKRFGKDEQPQPYVGKHGKWISDLFDGIPKSLRGTGLGYKIYKEFIKFKGYVSSSSWSGILSQSVWKKLSQDPDLYGILVNYEGKTGNIILFSKNYSGDYEKVCQDFINKAKEGKLYKGDTEDFKIKSIEIDQDLKTKLKELL